MDTILSLGSNLGDRLAHLVQAREALAHLPQTRLVASSRVYLTEPVGGGFLVESAVATSNAQRPTLNVQQNCEQIRADDLSLESCKLNVERWTLNPDNRGASDQSHDFFNAIIILETSMEVHAFSDAAHAIETRLGRKRVADRNAPRVIDIDLICCDSLQLDEPALQLPHPRAHLRRFVCEPLAELRPNLILPGQHLPILAILAQLPATPSVALAAEQW